MFENQFGMPLPGRKGILHTYNKSKRLERT